MAGLVSAAGGILLVLKCRPAVRLRVWGSLVVRRGFTVVCMGSSLVSCVVSLGDMRLCWFRRVYDFVA